MNSSDFSGLRGAEIAQLILNADTIDFRVRRTDPHGFSAIVTPFLYFRKIVQQMEWPMPRDTMEFQTPRRGLAPVPFARTDKFD